MNWTEGRLKRHASAKSLNSERAQQKRSFAKTRYNKVLQESAANDPDATASFFRVQLAGETTPDAMIPLSGSPSSRVAKSGRSPLISRTSTKSPPKVSTNKGETTRRNETEREAKRRKLLEKKDWVGVAIQKPLTLARPTPKAIYQPDVFTIHRSRHGTAAGKEREYRRKPPVNEARYSNSVSSVRSRFFPNFGVPDEPRIEYSPILHHPQPLRPDNRAVASLANLRSSASRSIATESDRHTDNLLPLSDNLPDLKINVNFLDQSSVLGDSATSLESPHAAPRQVFRDLPLPPEKTGPGEGVPNLAGPRSTGKSANNPIEVSSQESDSSAESTKSIESNHCEPRDLKTPRDPTKIRIEPGRHEDKAKNDGVGVHSGKNESSNPFLQCFPLVSSRTARKSTPKLQRKSTPHPATLLERPGTSPGPKAASGSPPRQLPPHPSPAPPPSAQKTDEKNEKDEEAWMKFVFGKEGSEEIYRDAFQEAKKDAAARLAPETASAVPSSITRDWGGRDEQDSETSGMARRHPVPAEFKAPSYSPLSFAASTPRKPPPPIEADDDESLFADLGGLTDEDILDTLLDSGRTNVATASQASRWEQGSTVAEAGSPWRRPAATGFVFSRPESFIGRNADTSRPFGVFAGAESTGNGRGRRRGGPRTRGGRRRRSDGRPSIRNIPRYDEDPIEDF